MFLSAYHFDGDPTELSAAYDRLMSNFPVDTLLFHAFVVGGTEVTIIDACPDQATHERFVVSPEFRGALAAAGLPEPRIEVLGETPRAYARASAVTVLDSAVPA